MNADETGNKFESCYCKLEDVRIEDYGKVKRYKIVDEGSCEQEHRAIICF